MAKATTAKAVQTVPTDPVELLSTPLAQSGLAAGATLRRAGIKLDFYSVRDLLFHLPRRYDDLREMRHLGDLVWETDGTVVSAQARVGDVRVEPGFRGRTQRTIARLEDDTGSIDATWFGRRFIERRLAVGAEIVVSGKVKHFGRKLTLDNPEFQVVSDDIELLHAGRIVPVYPLTAGLTADPPAGRDPRGARQGRPRLPRVPAGVDRRRGAAGADRQSDRGGPLPGHVRGSRRGPPAACLRRAAGAPARDGPAASPAGQRRGAADHHGAGAPTPRCGGPRRRDRLARRAPRSS